MRKSRTRIGVQNVRLQPRMRRKTTALEALPAPSDVDPPTTPAASWQLTGDTLPCPDASPRTTCGSHVSHGHRGCRGRLWSRLCGNVIQLRDQVLIKLDVEFSNYLAKLHIATSLGFLFHPKRSRISASTSPRGRP